MTKKGSNMHEFRADKRKGRRGQRIRNCPYCKTKDSVLSVYTPVYHDREHPTTDEYGRPKNLQYNHGHTDYNAFLICQECAALFSGNRYLHARLGIGGAYIISSVDYDKMAQAMKSGGYCIYADYYHQKDRNDKPIHESLMRLYIRKGRKPIGYFCPLCWSGTIYIKAEPEHGIKWQNGITVYHAKPLQREGSDDWPEFDALRVYGGYEGL